VSLRESVEADRSGPGGTCPVRLLIAGGVPSGSVTDVPLEPDDREFLAESCAPGSPAVLAKIQRHLVDDGYRVGTTALVRHRRRDCSCP
jgi:hypothetical protein